MMTETDKRVIAAKQYIDENYGNTELGCDFLAEHCVLSSRHLRRLFSRYYNIGVREYIMTVRLEKAKKLLTESSMSVEKIITKVGYNSPRYFRKYFKANVGCTMSEYRTNLKKQEGFKNEAP